MSLISTRRALLLLCVVCASVVAGILLWNRAHIQPKITDRWLLREAVKEWKREGVPYPGPSYQIFEQQAGQGYYEDAMTTAHQLYSPDDIRWAVVELAKIRTENGDLQGAKDALKNVSGSNLGNEALKEIAAVQARRGDIEGALATVADIGDADEVLLIFARRQLHNGDFDGALRTAEKMNIKSADQVFMMSVISFKFAANRNRFTNSRPEWLIASWQPCSSNYPTLLCITTVNSVLFRRLPATRQHSKRQNNSLLKRLLWSIAITVGMFP